MKSSYLRLLIISFTLLLGKSIFDIKFFSAFFNQHHSNYDITLLLTYTSIIGLLVTITFNFLQRVFLYRVPIIFTYILLFATLSVYQLNEIYHFNEKIEILLASLNLTINFLIILSQKGIISRLTSIQNKITERSINIGNTIGLLTGSIVFIYLSDLTTTILGTNGLFFVSMAFLILSAIFTIIYFYGNKQVNYLQDNIQTIKTSQRFYKLVFQKYFLSILLLMILAVSAISLSYGFFIKTNTTKYTSSTELANLLSILVFVYALISLAYEFFFKEKLIYILNMKVNLQLLTIAISIFSIVFILNTFLFNINEKHEFFFFVSIFAVLFIIFTQFIFLNIFYPAINRLYLPLDNNTSNDFYIKSSYYGIFLGIGVAALVCAFILPGINIKNNSNYIVGNFGLLLILYPIIRYLVYSNYKKALHSKLHKESQSDFHQESFINTILSNINNFKGAEWIRIINLVQLINPIKAKEVLKNLSNSEDTIAQRIGIIGAIKYYLLSIYNDMKNISKTKYYASSPNRDKIDQLIVKFAEVERKMQKHNYISQLSISKKEEERIHSSLIVGHAPQNEREDIINRLINDNSSQVSKNAIIAADTINNKVIINSTIKKLGDDRTANAAFYALSATGENYIELLEEAFNRTGQKEQVQIRIIQVLGKIASEKSIEQLLKKLNHTNQNIVSEALIALSNCNIELPDNKKYAVLEELEDTCKYIVWNTSYMVDLNKYGASNKLLRAMETELKENYIKMYNLLSLLYNPGSIDLIKKNLNSNKIEKIAFALELSTVIIKDEIKPMIIPLLRPLKNEQRVKKMSSQFITESLNIENLLYDLIQRDSKWVNGWTKACSIMELKELTNNSHQTILLANMVNPDAMISELSASILKDQDKKIYRKNIKNLKNNIISIIGQKSFSVIDESDSNKKTMPILKHEIIEYLQTIDEFKGIPGEILKHLTSNINPIIVEKENTIYEASHYEVQPFFYIIYEGEVELKINGKTANIYHSNSFLSSIDLHIDYKASIEITSVTKTKLYKLNTFELISNLNLYDIISSSIIKNSNDKTTNSNYKLLLKEISLRKGNKKRIHQSISLN